MPKSISRKMSDKALAKNICAIFNKPKKSTARKQDPVLVNLRREIERLGAEAVKTKEEIRKLKDDRSHLRLVIRHLLGHIRNTILDEPELPGKMPFDIRVQLLLHPTKTMRCLVKETKSSIAVKVDMVVQEFFGLTFPLNIDRVVLWQNEAFRT